MTFDPLSIAVFLAAVGLLGLSKGGLAGLGIISMPMMLLVMPPAAAAGLMLPVLIIQDCYSLWLYRWQWDKKNLRLLLPAAGVGIAAGFALFAILPAKPMLGVLGAVTLAFALHSLLTPGVPARTPSRPVGWALGAVSGLTSTVLHHGGPPFQMYLLPQRLPRDVFVGTSVAFFAILNIVKLPGFVWVGGITRDGLLVALVSAPFSLAMTWLGARLTRMLSVERYYLVIQVILAAVGVKLLADAFL
jgi:uncharacterized membrane protein YfcA